jgi:hypothetical protein
VRPNGLETVAAVTTFIEDTVLPGVAQEHRSELRAALKLLRAARDELDVLPVVLYEEISELVDLCTRAEDLRDIVTDCPPLPLEPTTLSDLSDVHQQARVAVTTALLALQVELDQGQGSEATRALLGAIFRALGRHAERRLPWQNVFSSTTPQGAL